MHVVHRIGGAILGAGLFVFGVLGLLDMPTFFGAGRQTMGMGSNGALAVLSVLVGALLLVAAVRGGRASSTVSLVVGALFLLSGFVHLAILNTGANVLGFGLTNVFFSFAAGVLLLTLGAYGRVSGGLAPDNPYARGGTTAAGSSEDPSSAAHLGTEQAVATGRATPEQHANFRAYHVALADETHNQSWQNFAATHTPAEVAHMQRLTRAESTAHPDQPV